MKLKKNILTITLVVSTSLVVAFIAACTTQAADPAKESETVFKGIPVDAVIVNPGKSSDHLVVTGTILANQEVSLVSELTRKVTGVYVREGSNVKKGAVLFDLDRADLMAQLDRLQQQEKLALLNEAGLKDLIAKEAVTQQDYDEASTNLNVLQAEIHEMNVTISKTRIIAPFNGQVGLIDIHLGAVVSVNTVLAQLEDNSVVKVEFTVPEKYANILRIGSEEHFTTPADDREYKTRIIAKAASLSTDTRTLTVRGITTNSDGKLLSGQSARINLSLSTSLNSLNVSSNALIPSTGGYNVFVSRNNTATAIPVQIGQRRTGTVEILSGLSAGDTLITSNLLRLGTGTRVDLVSIH